MFQPTFSAVRSVFLRSRHKPLLAPGRPVSSSAESASSAAARITEAYTKLQSTASYIPAANASNPPVNPIEPTRAQQIVWLAKHSFATSDLRKGQVPVSDGSKQKAGDVKNEGVAARGEPCTKSWDGPTPWAHLW